MITAKTLWLILLFLDLFIYAYRIGRCHIGGTYTKEITLGGSIYNFLWTTGALVLIYFYLS